MRLNKSEENWNKFSGWGIAFDSATANSNDQMPLTNESQKTWRYGF